MTECPRLLSRTFLRWKIYLSGMNTAAAREALGLAWSNGVDWVNYVGHGGLDRLAEKPCLPRPTCPDSSTKSVRRSSQQIGRAHV